MDSVSWRQDKDVYCFKVLAWLASEVDVTTEDGLFQAIRAASNEVGKSEDSIRRLVRTCRRPFNSSFTCIRLVARRHWTRGSFIWSRLIRRNLQRVLPTYPTRVLMVTHVSNIILFFTFGIRPPHCLRRKSLHFLIRLLCRMM